MFRKIWNFLVKLFCGQPAVVYLDSTGNCQSWRTPEEFQEYTHELKETPPEPDQVPSEFAKATRRLLTPPAEPSNTPFRSNKRWRKKRIKKWLQK